MTKQNKLDVDRPPLPRQEGSVARLQEWMAGLRRFMGIEPEQVSMAEKLVSTLGGTLGILLIAVISYRFTGASGVALIVPSMGASAVLLFAVPHGRLSQPWALFGGNLLAAVVGVSCYMWLGDGYLSAALAVGLAIGAMHLLRCMHPPGGATALAAVVGGPSIHALGYGYALTPILINVAVIFVVALGFNNIFPWRRYPAGLMRFRSLPVADQVPGAVGLDRGYLEQAMADMDMVIDVTTDDLHELFRLAMGHAAGTRLQAHEIALGHYYTNGRHGPDWSVRQIIDEAPHPSPDKDLVIYRVVEGQGLRSSGSSTRNEFAAWAARELLPNEH